MMATMMSREAWTDERLDDLNGKVDHGFARMDARFDRMEARLERMDERSVERMEGMEERFDVRFDQLYHLLVQGGFVMIAALIGLIATQL